MKNFIKDHWDVVLEYILPAIFILLVVLYVRLGTDSTGWTGLAYAAGAVLLSSITIVIFGLIGIYRHFKNDYGWIKLALILLPVIVVTVLWLSIWI